ncbi:hypothetical protein YDYSG_45440 [Paenibacillus tyrfis]|nr:hypothetical protein YDYSG_45440 [Paenibacillus tyrfis]
MECWSTSIAAPLVIRSHCKNDLFWPRFSMATKIVSGEIRPTARPETVKVPPSVRSGQLAQT